MRRHMATGRMALLAAAAAVGVVLPLGFSACVDETLGPQASEEEAALTTGVNVYLTLDRGNAQVGARVTVSGKVRVVDTEMTPTGYLVDVVYDAAKLQPVDALKLDDGVLRVVNIDADPGLVKAAGAAPDGLKTDVLFEVEMEVLAEGYADGLEVVVHELSVIEDNFADVTLGVATPPAAVVLSR